jgi:hypothetical protein
MDRESAIGWRPHSRIGPEAYTAQRKASLKLMLAYSDRKLRLSVDGAAGLEDSSPHFQSFVTIPLPVAQDSFKGAR